VALTFLYFVMSRRLFAHEDLALRAHCEALAAGTLSVQLALPSHLLKLSFSCAGQAVRVI
jgi:hypothetical protein